MAQLNVMKAIKENEGKMDIRYSLNVGQVKEILKNCRGQYDMIDKFFTIGYIQGEKAAKAKMKRDKKIAGNDSRKILKENIKQNLNTANEQQLKAIYSFKEGYLK